MNFRELAYRREGFTPSTVVPLDGVLQYIDDFEFPPDVTAEQKDTLKKIISKVNDNVLPEAFYPIHASDERNLFTSIFGTLLHATQHREEPSRVANMGTLRRTVFFSMRPDFQFGCNGDWRILMLNKNDGAWNSTVVAASVKIRDNSIFHVEMSQWSPHLRLDSLRARHKEFLMPFFTRHAKLKNFRISLAVYVLDQEVRYQFDILTSLRGGKLDNLKLDVRPFIEKTLSDLGVRSPDSSAFFNKNRWVRSPLLNSGKVSTISVVGAAVGKSDRASTDVLNGLYNTFVALQTFLSEYAPPTTPEPPSPRPTEDERHSRITTRQQPGSSTPSYTLNFVGTTPLRTSSGIVDIFAGLRVHPEPPARRDEWYNPSESDGFNNRRALHLAQSLRESRLWRGPLLSALPTQGNINLINRPGFDTYSDEIGFDALSRWLDDYWNPAYKFLWKLGFSHLGEPSFNPLRDILYVGLWLDTYMLDCYHGSAGHPNISFGSLFVLYDSPNGGVSQLPFSALVDSWEYREDMDAIRAVLLATLGRFLKTTYWKEDLSREAMQHIIAMGFHRLRPSYRRVQTSGGLVYEMSDRQVFEELDFDRFKLRSRA